uniref:Solute carrier family 6 member 14 n=1 Tax=Cynoglossus semilaevis TaxID=244447 RepID=A0A3P8UUL3_CYNSE
AQENLVDDPKTERGNWNSKSEYLLSLIGCIIGLDNIWKFPHTAYKNGGGVFLIPYFLILFVCGLPLFLLEAAIGQFCSQGPINMWGAIPILKGVGFSMVIVNGLVAIYYNVLIAYSSYFMFASLQSSLPWSNTSSWTYSNSISCSMCAVLMPNGTQQNSPSLSEQYWDDVVLQRSSGLDQTGSVVWHLALCLLLSSIVVAVVVIKGIKSSGKVMYVTSIFPYVVMLILLIRGVTLEGAKSGIDFFIGSPINFTKLTDVEIWKDAATQTFYSLAIGWGGVATYTSYNNFHNNVVLDSVFICIFNHVFSVAAGITVFSVLGHMSFTYGRSVESMLSEGFALAFIVYPDAMTTLPVSPLWSFLFFLMLAVIGLQSQFGLTEVITTSLSDSFPEILVNKRPFVSVGTCILLFLLGLVCVTQAGIYWVVLIDNFSAGWILSILALLEVIGFCYIYGVNRLIDDFKMMLGNKNTYFWWACKACWVVVSPSITLAILIWSLVDYVPPTYGWVHYPDWGLSLGWCMVAFDLVWIPIVAAYKLSTAEGSLWKIMSSPSEDWHPYLDVNRGERYQTETWSQQIKMSNNNKDKDVDTIP